MILAVDWGSAASFQLAQPYWFTEKDSIGMSGHSMDFSLRCP